MSLILLANDLVFYGHLWIFLNSLIYSSSYFVDRICYIVNHVV